MRDTDDAMFFWGMAIGCIGGAVVFVVFLLLSTTFPIASLALVIGWLIALSPLLLSWYVIQHSPINVGSNKRYGDSRAFAVLRRIAGTPMADCGCLYRSVWHSDSPPPVEVEESTPVWVREEDGAKIHYKNGEEQFVRCEHCGNRYYRMTKVPPFDTRTFWDDDPEPWPDDSREVMEAGR